MIKIFKVFLRDLKNIFKNHSTVIIILGLCILPSLYAWINIKACWDPYANTGNLPIAIVNNDEGTVFNDKKVNVGAQIVEELKKNKSINWNFVDQWQGNYGLNDGKYYALIDIPADFSKGLVSLTTVTPDKPDITYRVNEKLNAIAAKITNAAKTELADEVKSNFVATVNKEAFQTLNTVGGNLQLDKNKILQIKDTVNQAYNDIGDIKKYITEANASSVGLQKYLTNVKGTLPKITEQINSLENATEASKSLVLSTKQTINTTATDLNNDIEQVQSLNQQVQGIISNLKDINNNYSTDDIINMIDQMNNIYSSMSNIIDSDISSLTALNQTYNNSTITDLINGLKALKVLIATEQGKLTALKTSISGGASKDQINSSLDQISLLSTEIANTITTVSNSFYTNGMNTINTLANNMTVTLDSVDSILESTKVIVPQLNAIANYGIATSRLSVEQANDISNKLTTVQDELSALSDKMKDLNEKNLDDIINIMEMNPEKIASFLSSPVDVKNVEIYNAGIFGVGLTPFYTVLAIWVGALLSCALLSVECEDFEEYEEVECFVEEENNYYVPRRSKKRKGLFKKRKHLKKETKLSLRQKHFGKMIFFLLISIIQSSIVTLGDKYILGISPANMTLLMEFAILSGITFMTIIYTLVSIFGNVGKAIAVVIMVFQIAGSGGIYPIQTNPKIFGLLQPLWPFTYAINGFREAIAGPIWSSVNKNITALLCFLAAFIFLSVLKKPFHKVTEFMEHKFKEAGI